MSDLAFFPPQGMSIKTASLFSTLLMSTFSSSIDNSLDISRLLGRSYSQLSQGSLNAFRLLERQAI